MYDEEEVGEAIDWEAPFDDIRSSELTTPVQLEFLDNGYKIQKEDDKGELYTQFKWRVIRKDISNPREVLFLTSSKRLIEDMTLEAPMEGKILEISKSGTGFQTRYKVKEV